MGAPTLLGGGTFEVDERSIVPAELSIWRRRPNPAALAILSAVVPELQRAGYETTKPRRGKPDDVRCRCSLDSTCLELILVAERGAGTSLPFFLMAWDLSEAQVLGRALTERQAHAWQQLSSIMDGAIKQFDPTALTWLSPREVDARFVARSGAE